MQLLKAFYAFYRTLFNSPCEHPHVTMGVGEDKSAGSFCRDCGYQVRLRWTFCRCRTCGSKRSPKQELDGCVSPLFRYCQHCGQADFQIINKPKIHAYELPYAILLKEIDYSETPLHASKRDYQNAYNPFNIYQKLNIVEGELLGKEETIVPRGRTV